MTARLSLIPGRTGTHRAPLQFKGDHNRRTARLLIPGNGRGSATAATGRGGSATCTTSTTSASATACRRCGLRVRALEAGGLDVVTDGRVAFVAGILVHFVLGVELPRKLYRPGPRQDRGI